MSSYSISQAGLALLRQGEGYRAEPAQLPDGNWVVGHGHVRVGDPGAPVTEQDAEGLLALDVAPLERCVNDNVKASISQGQFDALVSFAFSVGPEAFVKSAVLRRVNAGDHVAAACAMDAWRKSDVAGETQIIDALVRRRAAEKAAYLADCTIVSAPSAFMRAKLDHAADILGAPAAAASAPEVGTILPTPQKPEPAERITEILKSEPATETLLLTQVVPDEVAEEEIVARELVTAHAKPKARTLAQSLDVARNAARAAADQFTADKNGFSVARSAEHLGLGALFVFGLALVALGASMLINGRGDAIDWMGAAALTAPGLAAIAMAAFGIWKGPPQKRA